VDIRLELQNEFGSDENLSSLDSRYKPRLALQNAVNEWLGELTSQRDPPKRKPPASVPSVPVEIQAAPEVVLNTVTDILSTPLPATGESGVEVAPVINASFLQPLAQSQPLNSLAADSSSDSDLSSDTASVHSLDLEPMDCVQSSVPLPAVSNLNVVNAELAAPAKVSVDCVDPPMQVEQACPGCGQNQNAMPVTIPSCLTYEDVTLLVDLFYLPFEHGSYSLQLLHDLHWLINNKHLLQGTDSSQVSKNFHM
jgi:protein O-GlcNAcase/histone acetyltransferase